VSKGPLTRYEAVKLHLEAAEQVLDEAHAEAYVLGATEDNRALRRHVWRSLQKTRDGLQLVNHLLAKLK